MQSGESTENERSVPERRLALKLMTDSLSSGFFPHLGLASILPLFLHAGITTQIACRKAPETVGRHIMTLLLQCRSSKLYLAADNRWTKDIKSALKFQSSTVLFKTAKELHLPDAQAVYRFRDPAYNFATPCLDWSITAPRSRRHHLCGREQLSAK